MQVDNAYQSPTQDNVLSATSIEILELPNQLKDQDGTVEVEEMETVVDRGGDRRYRWILSRLLCFYYRRRTRYKSSEERMRRNRSLIISLSVVLIFLIIAAYLAAILVHIIVGVVVEKNRRPCHFNLVKLGAHGGLTEENLSSFMISRNESNLFVAFDAGSLFHGLRQFVEREGLMSGFDGVALEVNPQMSFSFPDWCTHRIQRAGYVLQHHVRAFFISHAHLDHVASLMHVSRVDQKPSDSLPKPIIGQNSTLTAIHNHLFNNIILPDISSLDGTYRYWQMENESEHRVSDIAGDENVMADVTVKAFSTCHENIITTAYLFMASDAQVLFLSDTGTPSIHKDCDWKGKLHTIFKDSQLDLRILKAVIIGTSFPDEVDDSKLFGHLRPKDTIQLLSDLAQLQNAEEELESLRVVIYHIKPNIGPTTEEDKTSSEVIEKQLSEHADTNGIRADFVFMEQGEMLCLD